MALHEPASLQHVRLLQLEEELRTSLGHGLRLETDPETGFARGYRFEFERVLRALVQHAAETCSDGADLVVSTGRVPASEAAAGSGGFVTLSVAAPGPGLDAAGQARLFERAAGMGDEPSAGVDAAIPLERVRRVLQDQGGDLSIHSENGVGTTLTAWLPAEPAETPEAGKPDGSAGS